MYFWAAATTTPSSGREEVWREDVELMREAGVNLVTRRRLHLGAAGAGAGRVTTFGWLDRVLDLLDDDGIAGRPGHGDRVAAALVRRAAPGDAAGRPRRARPVAGRPADLLPQLAGLPRTRAAALAERLAERYGEHPALALWHVSNEYGCQCRCYCDGRRGGLPRLAAGPLRRPGRAQRRLGHDVLEPALQRLGRDRAAAATRRPPSTRRSSWTSCASAPTRCSPATGAERDVLREAHPRRAGDHQLHGRQLQAARLLEVGAREVDIVANDHYLDPPTRDAAHRAGLCADLTRGLARRRAVAADGALHQRGQLAAAQHPQAPGRAGPQQPGPRGPRRGRRAVLPVAGLPLRRGEVPLRDAPARRRRHRIWREVPGSAPTCAAGGGRGLRVSADVAIVFDWQSVWAQEQAATRAST